MLVSWDPLRQGSHSFEADVVRREQFEDITCWNQPQGKGAFQLNVDG